MPLPTMSFPISVCRKPRFSRWLRALCLRWCAADGIERWNWRQSSALGKLVPDRELRQDAAVHFRDFARHQHFVAIEDEGFEDHVDGLAVVGKRQQDEIAGLGARTHETRGQRAGKDFPLARYATVKLEHGVAHRFGRVGPE